MVKCEAQGKKRKSLLIGIVPAGLYSLQGIQALQCGPPSALGYAG